MKFILLDIEGTTTSIDFVHNVLFPYSQTRMASYLQENANVPVVAKLLDDVRHTVLEEDGKMISAKECTPVLLRWIAEDRKHPVLKLLQGYLWQKGYESGEIQGHVYADVPLAFERWKRAGLGIGIYSSGSVLAQLLIFGKTAYGDLNRYLDGNFDTEVGPKREASSYTAISQRLKIPPAEILFLSDIPEELAAAKQAGLAATQVVREGTMPHPDYTQLSDFNSL